MKEEILNFIRKNRYVTAQEIYAHFSYRRQDIALMMQTLLNDGEIIFEDEHYVLPETLGLLLGEVVSVKDTFAFVHLFDAEEDMYITDEDLMDAILGDRVYIRPHQYGGAVVKIVARKYHEVVGEVKRDKKGYYVEASYLAPLSTRFSLDDYQGAIGDVVVCHFKSSKPRKILLEVVKVLGAKNAPGMDMTRLILENNAPISFPNDVEVEVLALPLEVKEEEASKRLDLRNELIVTIDGEDARDLDDAVSIQKMKDGYILGVHIADVSHYVKENTALDKEAVNRGTSIYVTDRVVPMLPFSLSNGICSLNPNVDRLTISCIMNVNDKGEVVSSQIQPSIIRSKYRLTYTYVNEVIEKNHPESELEETLLLMHELSQLVRARRNERGALDLSVPEIKIEVDQEGKAIGIHKKIQKEGEKLIEDFMILANETIAETIHKRNLPFIYRIHEQPKVRKLETWMSFTSRMGNPIYFSPLNVKPKDLQQYLISITDDAKKEIISTFLLRSLAKARYSAAYNTHFGLASSCYTHFTSPIRRYPDLIVHRLLRKYLFEKDFSSLKELEEKLVFLAEDTSFKERRAVTIERESVDYKGAEYMQNHIGDIYEGHIDGMNNRGMFVELENGLSGLLKFEDFSDYFVLDEQGISAFSRRRGLRFVVSDKVKVQVVDANPKKGEITLRLVESYRRRENPHLLRRHSRRR